MPSFTKIALALVTLSASVFAGTLEEGDIFHQNGLEKRVIGSETNVTPVADLEKRAPAANIGQRCRYNASCRTRIHLAKPFCNAARRCDFRCTGGSVRQGNRCVGAPKPKACRFNANCPRTRIPNAYSVCSPLNNRCTFRCLSGWHASGNRCVKNQHLCGGKSCPKVHNGYAICRNGRWIPQCNFYLGFKLYVNGGVYSCVNTQVDPNNCGRAGRVCPPGYNGLGRPSCTNGVCGLNCNGFRTRTLPNGQKYCSRV